MLLTISDGAQKEINPGDMIQLKPGHVPNWFDGKGLEVKKIEQHSGVWYPFVRFFHQEQNIVSGEWSTVIDEESAVSSEIIL